MAKSQDGTDVVFEDLDDEDVDLDLSVNVMARTSEETSFASLCGQLGDALLAGNDLESMLRALLNRAFELVPAQRGSICLWNPETEELSPIVSRRGPAPAPISISRTITEKVLTENQAILVTDTGDDSVLASSESIAAMSIQSVMCAPMYHNGTVRGFIYLDTIAPEGGFLGGMFTEDHLELLISIAVFAAVCVEKGELLNRINEETAQRLQVANRIRVMLDVAKSLTSELDTDVLVHKIMQSARELLQAERCTLFTVDVATGEQRPLLSGSGSYMSPRWSPDGTRLAYVAAEGGSAQLRR